MGGKKRVRGLGTDKGADNRKGIRALGNGNAIRNCHGERYIS